MHQGRIPKSCFAIDRFDAKEVLLIVVLLALNSACTLHASRHDPESAATVALEFGKAALIDLDVDKAYDLLDPEAKSNVPKGKFAEILSEINSDGHVSVLTATEFEPALDPDIISIYLVGDTAAKKIYFRVPLRGNNEVGYKPFGLLRGEYAPSESRRPLQVKRSTS